MLRVLPLLLMFGVGVYAFIDCLTTEEDKVRGLPKLAWVFILLLFWPLFLGPIGWFVAGRPRREASAGRYGRSRTVHVAPDDNPEFLASLNQSNKEHEDLLRQWEEDLKRREDDPSDPDVRGGDETDGDGRKKD